MERHPEEALELDEGDIFDHGEQPGAEGVRCAESDHLESDHSEEQHDVNQQHQQESEDEELFELHVLRSGSMEIGPGDQHNGSAKSTTLNVVLEEQDGVLLEEEESPSMPSGQPAAAWGPMSMAVSARQRSCRMGSQQSWMAQSLPVHGAGIMGSSVPISIPAMSHRSGPKDAANPAQAAPQTFVPPHQLSQRDEYTLVMMGESPGGAMRRDRLRMRNSILKSTGFLENPSLLPGMVAGVGIVGGGELHMQAITPMRGGLAQALQLSSSPAVR